MRTKTACLVSIVLLAGPVLTLARGPKPVGWWNLDGDARDTSGNANHGTLVGNPSFGQGMIGPAIDLDGSSQNVEVPDGPSLHNFVDQITVTAWINPLELGNSSYYRTIVAKFGPSDRKDLYLYLNVNLGAALAGPQGNDWTPNIPIDIGIWTHVALTYDGSAMILYKNGIALATLGVTGNLILADASSNGPLFIGYNTSWIEYFSGLMDDVRLYNVVLTADEILAVMEGGTTELAADPVPVDEGNDVPRDVVLRWTRGEYAVTHDVYFGTAFDDVNDASRTNPLGVLVSRGQTAATYDPPGLLEFGTTYYWRVDEVNAPPSTQIFKGKVWSFTSEPFAYPVANIIATTNGVSDETSGPERTIDGSGLNAADQHSTEATDMWLALPGAEPLYIQYEFDRVYKLHEMLVWNYNVQFEMLLGFGVKGVTVEYSENGADWTALGEFEFARATAKATYAANTAVPFDGLPAKFVRLNVNSGYGPMGQFGLSEVRFMYIPAHAREPQPADGAANVEVNAALAWRSGREAVSHEVYLGTAPDALALAGTVSSATFTPALEFGSTYYWQVVEVNAADAVTAWTGDVWDFSTQEYASIDGFEAYNDDVEAGTAIFDTWLDGWINDTGSTVGYFNSPFAERSIVHGGSQSMPLQYDNSGSPFYSEAWREFETAQNWTGNGADRLVLYVRGNPPAFKEAADGSIIMSAIGTDIWDTSDQFRYAYKNLSGNGSITVRVDSLIRSNEWAKAGVMIRETLEPGSKHAFTALTPEPAHGLSFQRRPVAGQASANTDVANIPLPHWVRVTRTGNAFTAHYSADGVTWTAIAVSPAVEITMASNVFIGLAVCSHDAGIMTAAEFSNVSMTGSVTGAWQTAEIGVAQPLGNDTAEPMYVRIEDAAGKSATAVSADASINQRPSWQEWTIPYSALSSVNLSRVNKMVIGVGSKTSPKAGGSGTVYVDDIGFGRPAAQ